MSKLFKDIILHIELEHLLEAIMHVMGKAMKGLKLTVCLKPMMIVLLEKQKGWY
jgi:hypothetical protein